VIVLSGEGYSLMWAEATSRARYEWQAGSMNRAAEHVVPPAFQHRHGAGALPRLQARSHLDSQ